MAKSGDDDQRRMNRGLRFAPSGLQLIWAFDGDDTWVVTRSQDLLHLDNNVQLAASDFLL